LFLFFGGKGKLEHRGRRKGQGLGRDRGRVLRGSRTRGERGEVRRLVEWELEGETRCRLWEWEHEVAGKRGSYCVNYEVGHRKRRSGKEGK
jgi:hypothetical protein